MGRENVCVIKDKAVDSPSDINGIVYIDSKEWKAGLKREIEAWSSSLGGTQPPEQTVNSSVSSE